MAAGIAIARIAVAGGFAITGGTTIAIRSAVARCLFVAARAAIAVLGLVIALRPVSAGTVAAGTIGVAASAAVVAGPLIVVVLVGGVAIRPVPAALRPSTRPRRSSATALPRPTTSPGRVARLTLGVERSLKQQCRGSLVDHGTALPGVAAALTKRGMGDDCRETLVDEPDRIGATTRCERFGKVSCLVSGLSSFSGKASGEPDDNFDHMPVGRQPRNLGKIATAAAHRRERAGQ